MRRPIVLAVLLLTCACSKSAPSTSEPPAAASASGAAAPSLSVAAATSPSASQAPAASGVWSLGTWKGEFASAKRPAGLTKKEGAPAAWDKDDGKRLAGPTSVEIKVDANGNVSGSVQGALGELGVRGKVEGDELRANLVPKSDDLSTIQNGYLVLKREADSLKGRLSAASGDALVMRHGELVLQKSAQQ